MEEFLVYPEKVSKDIINIPVYEQAFSAGKGQELPDTAEILEYVAIPKTLMRFKDNICAAYVRGDSMEPTLFDDDIIIFDNFGYDGTYLTFPITRKSWFSSPSVISLYFGLSERMWTQSLSLCKRFTKPAPL